MDLKVFNNSTLIYCQLFTENEEKKWFLFPDVENDIDEDSLPRVVKDVEGLLNGNGLNLVIHNAGRNSKNEGKLTKDVLTKDFTTNVFAPLLLTKVCIRSTSNIKNVIRL